jgi:hypothetical protein
VRLLSKCMYACHDLVCRALNAIVTFAAHSAKRGTIVRTIRKSKDEEKLLMLRETLEEAFKRLQVRLISTYDHGNTQQMLPSAGGAY